MTELVQEMQNYYDLRAELYDESMGYLKAGVRKKMLPVAKN